MEFRHYTEVKVDKISRDMIVLSDGDKFYRLKGNYELLMAYRGVLLAKYHMYAVYLGNYDKISSMELQEMVQRESKKIGAVIDRIEEHANQVGYATGTVPLVIFDYRGYKIRGYAPVTREIFEIQGFKRYKTGQYEIVDNEGIYRDPQYYNPIYAEELEDILSPCINRRDYELRLPEEEWYYRHPVDIHVLDICHGILSTQEFDIMVDIVGQINHYRKTDLHYDLDMRRKMFALEDKYERLERMIVLNAPAVILTDYIHKIVRYYQTL